MTSQGGITLLVGQLLQHFPRFEGGYDNLRLPARQQPLSCNTFPVLKGVMTLPCSWLRAGRCVATLSPF